MKVTAQHIELAVAHHFGTRAHVMVPNLSWGMMIGHECDLAILSSSNYLYEVEIKVSRGDLIRDKGKRKWLFYDERGFRKLWFAIPGGMENSIEFIPDFAGVLIVNWNDDFGLVREIRKPKINKLAKKLTEREKFTFARLGAMRIWNLKWKLIQTKNSIRR